MKRILWMSAALAAMLIGAVAPAAARQDDRSFFGLSGPGGGDDGVSGDRWNDGMSWFKDPNAISGDSQQPSSLFIITPDAGAAKPLPAPKDPPPHRKVKPEER